ncbi:MAG: hypothetical protein HC819_24405, partial [Cyclobacteriaceae bacterium]|nr:hypothetical protein [Cyclobacteriaceae bacterium]
MITNKLHNIKETGFKVPDNYFESLEETILNDVKLKEKIAHSGFKTPDNYFESVEETIAQGLKQEK